MTDNLSAEKRFLDIEENLKEINYRIAEAAVKSGRRREEIRLMAVTKTVEPMYINHALRNGVNLIGENKVQELLSKLDFISPADVEKHLIGHLQSNKVRKVMDAVQMIESVDSLTLAAEISRQAVARGRDMDVLLEVNIGMETSKTGLRTDALNETAAAISSLPGIRIVGLMAVPPMTDDEKLQRRYFSEARRLFEDLGMLHSERVRPQILSLGMSADYEAAILEGSNLVRIGSALFGERRY